MKEDKVTASECLAGREPTLAESINDRITQHNQEIARLLRIKDRTPDQVLALPISTFAQLAALI